MKSLREFGPSDLELCYIYKTFNNRKDWTNPTIIIHQSDIISLKLISNGRWTRSSHIDGLIMIPLAYCAQILMVAHKKRVVHQLRDSQGRRKHSKSGWVDINSPTICLSLLINVWIRIKSSTQKNHKKF